MSRGAKICAKCQSVTGPRSHNCPSCGLGFTIHGKKYPDIVAVDSTTHKVNKTVNVADSRKELKNKEVDWKNLVKGDVVKSIGGGPVWASKNEATPEISMGYYGIFQVERLDENGIHAYPLKAKTEGSGHCYLYMSEDKKMKSGSIMKAHRIVRVHRKIKNNE